MAVQRDEQNITNAGNPDNVTTDDSSSFKYKSSILGNLVAAAGANGVLENAKIVVPLKYLSNFFRSLEMPLINCKIHLELHWSEDCVISNIGGAKSTKLYVPIVTLPTKDHVNLTKQLNEGFKRSFYWNEYKSKIQTKGADKNFTRFPLDASFQGVNRLFVRAFNDSTEDDDNNPINNTANIVQRDNHRKYILPRVEITSYNVVIDGRNFMINQSMIKSKCMMKLERLQQEKEMITQGGVY